MNAAFAGADLPRRLRLLRELVGGRIVFTTSLGIEDQAVTHAIAEAGSTSRWSTLDTGRLFPETYELWQAPKKNTRCASRPFIPRRRPWRR